MEGEGIQADGNSVFEAELQDVIPICHATIAGTRIIGRLTAGYVSSQNDVEGQEAWLTTNMQKPKRPLSTHEHNRPRAATPAQFVTGRGENTGTLKPSY